MTITYDVSITNTGRANKWIDILSEFIESDHKNMCLTFDTAKEALSARASLQNTIRRGDFKCQAILRDKCVYIVKGGYK